jgi:iron-sulfur cluster assembly accessory protein
MIVLTRPALAAIETSMNANGKTGQGVRLIAEAGGCSGPKYTMRFEEKPEENDAVIEIRNVRVFVDEASMGILSGATVDYSEDPENFGFNFTLALPTEEEASSCSKPPQAGGGCGCGKN